MDMGMHTADHEHRMSVHAGDHAQHMGMHAGDCTAGGTRVLFDARDAPRINKAPEKADGRRRVGGATAHTSSTTRDRPAAAAALPEIVALEEEDPTLAKHHAAALRRAPAPLLITHVLAVAVRGERPVLQLDRQLEDGDVGLAVRPKRRAVDIVRRQQPPRLLVAAQVVKHAHSLPVARADRRSCLSRSRGIYWRRETW